MRTEFDSLEQRVAASFYLVMPDFFANTQVDCTEEEQKGLYNFIKKNYEVI